jgi:DNA adenine methylase
VDTFVLAKPQKLLPRGNEMQQLLFGDQLIGHTAPLKSQLLKWVGNKQRFAHEIVSAFPAKYGDYFEPFLGSGAVLATLAPRAGLASDSFGPLMEIWNTLRHDPALLKRWYAERWQALAGGDKKSEYERVKASYNSNPNGADLLFLCRSCYGGVVRFRQTDGHMSTPYGIHQPISPNAFARRVDVWHKRLLHVRFAQLDFEEAIDKARSGDLVYCDPPYSHSQSILYGAQSFSLRRLFDAITRCKERGGYVVMSIDGTKKSGNRECELPIPDGLFARELSVNCGRSMLKRFQMGGQTLETEVVADRLLLTY